MKRKICSILLALVLVLSFSLLTAGPVSAAGPTTVNLGTAANFAVLASTGITGGNAAITGNIGIAATLSLITQFPPATVSGTIYATDAPTPGNTVSTTARADLNTAYLNAQGRTGAVTVPADIGGQNLGPGLYVNASSLAITTPLTLTGGPNDVWIFQIGSTLTTSGTGNVVLAGGANAANIFWQVGSSATLGAPIFKGNILANSSISVGTTAIAVEGRLLASAVVGGAVTFSALAHTVTTPTPTPTPTPTVGGEAYPINKVYVLAPWLILALAIVIGGSVLVLRRRTSR